MIIINIKFLFYFLNGLTYFITSKTHFKSISLLVNGAATLASASDNDKPTYGYNFYIFIYN